MTKLPVKLSDLFRYYKALPHQMAAVVELQEQLLKAAPTLLNRDQPWFKTWSQAGKQPDHPLWFEPGGAALVGLARRRAAEVALFTGAAPAPPHLPLQQGVLLNVPYEAQNDNASGTGYRECFSSSAAMVARYYGKITSDDAYNKFRAKYGDTTDAQAQLSALKALGLKARFLTNCTVALLEAELDAGRPVLVGWLHKGLVSSPTGGGHWSVVIGYTPTAFIHNDSNGEADLVKGGYISSKGGAGIAYSKKNWLPRWLIEGPNSGWALLVSR